MVKSVLILHGFTGSSQSWDSLRLQLPDFYRFTPNIAGHGDYIPDALADYHIEAEAQRIASLIDQPLNLFGYSMGGRLALTIAVHYPEKVQSLILESATAGLTLESERQARIQADNELADKIEANGLEWFADYWGSLPLWANQTPEQKASLYQQRLKNSPQGLANCLRGMGTGQMPPLWEALPKLKMPVKLIAGELDSKFLAINHEMQALIPNASLSVIPSAGHATHIEQSLAFIEVLQNFMATLKS